MFKIRGVKKANLENNVNNNGGLFADVENVDDFSAAGNVSEDKSQSSLFKFFASNFAAVVVTFIAAILVMGFTYWLYSTHPEIKKVLSS